MQILTTNNKIMIISTIEDFVSAVPTAIGTKWTAIAPYVVDADNEVQMVLTGSELYTYISALEPEKAMRVQLRNIIAFTAYRNAIPFVDLMQTDTGFAVVSNANMAPASSQRVERLLSACNVRIDRGTDLLITAVMQTAAALAIWKTFVGFTDMTNCLFITGIDFEGYFKQSDMKRKSFLDMKNDLMYCQNSVLAAQFGKAIIDELIDQIRTNSVTVANKPVIVGMKQLMGKYADGLRDEELKSQSGSFRMIYEGLKGNTTYESSPEASVTWAANSYENKAEHPTFFFG
jgi:hypothetical protein